LGSARQLDPVGFSAACSGNRSADAVDQFAFGIDLERRRDVEETSNARGGFSEVTEDSDTIDQMANSTSPGKIATVGLSTDSGAIRCSHA
jgi:hypothetical protein